MSKTSRLFSHYSNEYLFKKREKEFKLKQNGLTFHNLNQTFQNFYFRPKKQKRKYKDKNIDFSLLSHSTTCLLKEMSTEKSIRQNLYNKRFSVNYEMEKDKNRYSVKDKNFNKNRSVDNSDIILKNKDINVTDINKRINNLKAFSINNGINKSLVNIKMRIIKNNNIKEKESLNYMKKSNSFVNNIHKYDNNIRVLKYFQGKAKSNKNKNNLFMTSYKSKSLIINNTDREKYYTNLIDLKTKNFKPKKDTINEYMDKIKIYNIFNNEIKTNENINNNYIENSKNDLDYCDDLFRNLTKTKTLLNKKFSGAVEAYLRFIFMKTDEEKKKEYYLAKKILALREEVNKLNLVLKKKESEKNKILKWIYFQIKVREKILLIPSYYKEIIENVKRREIQKENRPMKFSRMSVKVSSSKRNKNFSVSGLTLRKSFKVKRALNSSKKDVNSYKGIKSNVDKEKIVSEEEIEKIKNYLKHPVFNNVDDLIDNLKVFENKILLKNKEYESLKEQIFKDKSYLRKNQKNIIKYQISYENLIKEKESQVEKLKIITNAKIIEKNQMQNLTDDKLLFSIFKDTNKKMKFETYPLFVKINSLYEKCSQIPLDLEYNFGHETKNSNSHPILLEMLFKLKYATIVADKILIEFKYYKENDAHKSALIKKFKSEIDKENKFIKNLEQQNKEKKKFIKLLNKIKEKNEKILFIPYRKSDKYRKVSQKRKINKVEDTSTSFYNFDI